MYNNKQIFQNSKEVYLLKCQIQFTLTFIFVMRGTWWCIMFGFLIFLQLLIPLWILQSDNRILNTLHQSKISKTQARSPPYNVNFTIYDTSAFWKASREEKHHKLCLLAAYRDSKDPRDHGIGRKQELEEFRREMKIQLGLRNVPYILIVSEQEEGLMFNKGISFNVGFLMAYQKCDYFIFHDIDMYPVSLDNTYGYPSDNPLHMCSSSNYWNITRNVAGGVLAMNHQQYIRVGGYSNGYWGWGFEDDDIYYRMKNANFTVDRLSPEVGFYKIISYKGGDIDKEKTHAQNRVSAAYSVASREGRVNYTEDGIQSVNATILKIVHDAPDYFHFIYKPNNRVNLIAEEYYHRPNE